MFLQPFAYPIVARQHVNSVPWRTSDTVESLHFSVVPCRGCESSSRHTPFSYISAAPFRSPYWTYSAGLSYAKQRTAAWEIGGGDSSRADPSPSLLLGYVLRHNFTTASGGRGSTTRCLPLFPSLRLCQPPVVFLSSRFPASIITTPLCSRCWCGSSIPFFSVLLRLPSPYSFLRWHFSSSRSSSPHLPQKNQLRVLSRALSLLVTRSSSLLCALFCGWFGFSFP